MTNVTDSTFEEILYSNEVCVLDFSATWCGPCKRLAPIIDELAEEYSGKAYIGKIDIEECPELTDKFGIMSVPTILFFKNGELQEDKIVGAASKQELENKIKALIWIKNAENL